MAMGMCCAQSARASTPEVPQRFAFLDAPPPAPPPFPRDPGSEPDEHPRRMWELVPAFGAAAPFCRGAGWCAGNGGAVELAALHRFTPYVALGADISWVSFSADAAGARAFSRASWMGLQVRGYFSEHGVVDPYLAAGIGRGTVAAGDSSVTVTGAGPSTMAGVGVDFWMLPYLRLGPALTYRWTWLSDTGTAPLAVAGSYLSLTVMATVAFGREM
jgi:hypothetical protein